MATEVILGDCVETMAGMDTDSFDAIVTDPPYGLEFMGKEWDSFRVDDPGTQRHRGEHAGSHGEATSGDGGHPARGGVEVAFGGGKRAMTNRCVGCGKRDQFRNPHACPPDTQWRKEIIDPHAAPPTMLAFQEWCRVWAREAYRVAKPGAHLLAFGGTRTYHRLTCALEDAGWEIRDCLVWAYASGFPKSLDVSKAIDKAAGAERERRLVPTKVGNLPEQAGPIALGATGMTDTSEPITDAAKRWQGWGTALKPAWEPIVLARKPLSGTVAANVERYGTGALNIDGTRIGTSDADRDEMGRANAYPKVQGGIGNDGGHFTDDAYIWPGKPYEPAAGRWPPNLLLTDAELFDGGVVGAGPGFSRFFAIAKASRSDREPVWGEELELGPPPGSKRSTPAEGRQNALGRPRKNSHPTTKPVDLMRHLVRLVTPPGGRILDPFLGSGTTAIAAIMEGFECVGIEREAEYVAIAEARLNGVQQGMGLTA